MHHIQKTFKTHYRMIHLLKTSGFGYMPMKSMINLNSRMDCFISRTFLHTFKAYIIQDNSNVPRSTCDWTFLASTKLWSEYHKIFGSYNCRNLRRNLYNRVIHVEEKRFHDIDHMAFFICSKFQRIHGYCYE